MNGLQHQEIKRREITACFGYDVCKRTLVNVVFIYLYISGRNDSILQSGKSLCISEEISVYSLPSPACTGLKPHPSRLGDMGTPFPHA